MGIIEKDKEMKGMRLEWQKILSIIKPNSRVLDIGCGEGELMEILRREKNAKVWGIDKDINKVLICLSKGLNVIQVDVDKYIPRFSDNSFDYIVFSKSLQELQKPKEVLREAIRIAKNIILLFPNFAHYKIRLKLLFKGEMPIITYQSGYHWFDTPDIHLFTLKDLKKVAKDLGLEITNIIPIVYIFRTPLCIHILPNLLAKDVIVVLSKKDSN